MCGCRQTFRKQMPGVLERYQRRTARVTMQAKAAVKESASRSPWRKVRAVHDPGKALLDVALAVALGGDCLADVAMLRCEPAIFGPVASDPAISRLIDTSPPPARKPCRPSGPHGPKCVIVRGRWPARTPRTP